MSTRRKDVRVKKDTGNPSSKLTPFNIGVQKADNLYNIENVVFKGDGLRELWNNLVVVKEHYDPNSNSDYNNYLLGFGTRLFYYLKQSSVNTWDYFNDKDMLKSKTFNEFIKSNNKHFDGHININ